MISPLQGAHDLPTSFDSASLEQRFGDIGQRHFADMPVYHDALQVCALGFQEYQGYWMGILITPWFMNLMAFPANKKSAETISPMQVGSKCTIALPASQFEFIKAVDDVLGDYLSCSLLSPVFELSSMDIAMETAELALLDMMTQPQAEQVEVQTMSRRDFFRSLRGDNNAGHLAQEENL